MFVLIEVVLWYVFSFLAYLLPISLSLILANCVCARLFGGSPPHIEVAIFKIFDGDPVRNSLACKYIQKNSFKK